MGFFANSGWGARCAGSNTTGFPAELESPYKTARDVCLSSLHPLHRLPSSPNPNTSMPVNFTPSNASTTVFKVAAVQAEPVWLDLQGSVNKTIKIINEAAAEGAKVCPSISCRLCWRPDLRSSLTSSDHRFPRGLHRSLLHTRPYS